MNAFRMSGGQRRIGNLDTLAGPRRNSPIEDLAAGAN